MAEAKICDKCGGFYKPYSNVFRSYQQEEYSISVETGMDDIIRADFCKSCLAELLDLFAKELRE